MPATYEPIASQTLGSAAASVTFSSIPGTYTDLVLVTHAANTAAATTHGPTARINSDSGSNYSGTYLLGNGSAAGSFRQSSVSIGLPFSWAGITFAAMGVMQIMSYANTNVFKTALTAYGGGDSEVYRVASLWRSTSAVTSLTLYPNDLGAGGRNFASGSTFSLYGIKAA